MKKLLLALLLMSVLAMPSMAQTPKGYYVTLAPLTSIVVDCGMVKGHGSTVAIPKLITVWNPTSSGNSYIAPFDGAGVVKTDGWETFTAAPTQIITRFWIYTQPTSFEPRSRYVKVSNANGASSYTIYFYTEY